MGTGFIVSILVTSSIIGALAYVSRKGKRNANTDWNSTDHSYTGNTDFDHHHHGHHHDSSNSFSPDSNDGSSNDFSSDSNYDSGSDFSSGDSGGSDSTSAD